MLLAITQNMISEKVEGAMVDEQSHGLGVQIQLPQYILTFPTILGLRRPVIQKIFSPKSVAPTPVVVVARVHAKGSFGPTLLWLKRLPHQHRNYLLILPTTIFEIHTRGNILRGTIHSKIGPKYW